MTTERTIAALCVHARSVYRTLPGVECYDAGRDCRTFAGGMPVVAHPPCRAWSAYCAHQANPAPGEKDLGPWCVEQIKANGGVLEHPAHSRLWQACNLPLPGWTARGDLWSMAVDQSWWGDVRKKATWLLFSGVSPHDLPVVPYRLRESFGDRRRWQVMSKQQRSASTKAFAEWLVAAARLTKAESLT